MPQKPTTAYVPIHIITIINHIKLRERKSKKEGGKDLSMGENEREVVIEIGEVRIVLEFLPNLRLIGSGGYLLFNQSTDLSETFFLWLPTPVRRHFFVSTLISVTKY